MCIFMNELQKEKSTEETMQEIKKDEKKIVSWIIWILFVFGLSYALPKINKEADIISDFQTWFDTFRTTGLALIYMIFIITMIIITIVLSILTKKKLDAWDGYNKDVRLNLDKYLNTTSTANLILLYISVMFLIVICEGIFDSEPSLYESIIQYLVSNSIILIGLFSLIIQWILKRYRKQYDEKQEEGFKCNLESDSSIRNAKKEQEIDNMKVSEKAFKLMNGILSISFCLLAILSIRFPELICTTIVIGLIQLIVHCYYSIEMSKI